MHRPLPSPHPHRTARAALRRLAGPLLAAAILLPALGLPLAAQKYDPSKQAPINDVYLIGHRNVAGGIDFYSMQKETALGYALAQQVLKSSILIKDPEVNEYINRLAQNLVRNSDVKVPVTVYVLRTPVINAFALPGGFFFVNSGLIASMHAEDQLAGVMAHELAHVACRHGTKNATKGELLSLATIPLVIVAGGSGLGGLGAEEAANFAIPLQYERFSRADEREADWLGIQYLWKAGYDPNGLVQAFQVLEEQQQTRPGIIARAFSSHPQTPARIQRSEMEIRDYLPPRPEYVVSTSDFNRMQARLEKILHGARVPKPGAPPVPRKSGGPPILKRPGSQ
ncbi:MAG: M48 family metallopeptidase [Terriglobales bacterium]